MMYKYFTISCWRTLSLISINYTKARRKKQLTCIVVRGMGNTILLSFKLHTEVGSTTQNIWHRKDKELKNIIILLFKLTFLLSLNIIVEWNSISWHPRNRGKQIVHTKASGIHETFVWIYLHNRFGSSCWITERKSM